MRRKNQSHKENRKKIECSGCGEVAIVNDDVVKHTCWKCVNKMMRKEPIIIKEEDDVSDNTGEGREWSDQNTY